MNFDEARMFIAGQISIQDKRDNEFVGAALKTGVYQEPESRQEPTPTELIQFFQDEINMALAPLQSIQERARHVFNRNLEKRNDDGLMIYSSRFSQEAEEIESDLIQSLEKVRNNFVAFINELGITSELQQERKIPSVQSLRKAFWENPYEDIFEAIRSTANGLGAEGKVTGYLAKSQKIADNINRKLSMLKHCFHC